MADKTCVHLCQGAADGDVVRNEYSIRRLEILVLEVGLDLVVCDPEQHHAPLRRDFRERHGRLDIQLIGANVALR